MSAVDLAEARLSQALNAANAADEELVAAALQCLVMQAREDEPAAVAIWLWWSDQGDFLDVRGLDLADGREVEWENEEVHNIAVNLGGHVASRWIPFVELTNIDTKLADFRLPIQPTLDRLKRPEEGQR